MRLAIQFFFTFILGAPFAKGAPVGIFDADSFMISQNKSIRAEKSDLKSKYYEFYFCSPPDSIPASKEEVEIVLNEVDRNLDRLSLEYKKSIEPIRPLGGKKIAVVICSFSKIIQGYARRSRTGNMFVHPRLNQINNRNIIWANQNIDLSTNETLINLIHEYAHLVRYFYNEIEDYWLDEALAEYFVYKSIGFPKNILMKMAMKEEFHLSFTRTLSTQSDYTFSFFYLLYLEQHFDEVCRQSNDSNKSCLIDSLLKSKESGKKSINEYLNKNAKKDPESCLTNFYSFESSYTQFAIAMTANSMARFIYDDCGLYTLFPRGPEAFGTIFSVMGQKLENQTVEMKPRAIRYYEIYNKHLSDIRKTCISIHSGKDQRVILVTLSKDKNVNQNQITAHYLPQEYCLPTNEEERTLILINLEEISKNIEFLN